MSQPWTGVRRLGPDLLHLTQLDVVQHVVIEIHQGGDPVGTVQVEGDQVAGPIEGGVRGGDGAVLGDGDPGDVVHPLGDLPNPP
jgi:hypothetical protein